MDYISWYCNKSCIIEPGTQRLINTNNNDDDTNDSDSTELSVKIHSRKGNIIKTIPLFVINNERVENY